MADISQFTKDWNVGDRESKTASKPLLTGRLSSASGHKEGNVMLSVVGLCLLSCFGRSKDTKRAGLSVADADNIGYINVPLWRRVLRCFTAGKYPRGEPKHTFQQKGLGLSSVRGVFAACY